MILTKQEVLDLAEHNMPMFSLKEAQFRICDFAEAIERAVLAKAGEQLPVAIKGCGAWDGLECLDELPDGLALYASPLPAQAIPEGWQPIGAAPKTGRKILLSLLNIAGKRRTIVGFWVEKFSVEDNSDDDQGEEKDGTYYWREGWYESMESHDDFSCLYAAQESITNWMPLPDTSMLSASPKQ